MAALVGDEALIRPPLLLYLAHAGDLQRSAVAPALAAAAERAGWGFECYYDSLRKGRHFGGGDPAAVPSGWAAGSLVAGGRHADRLLWLAASHAIVALGDSGSPMWPVVEAAGGEGLVRSRDPAELFEAAFERMRQPLPSLVRVVDGQPQGSRGLVVAPYLYPAFLGPALLRGETMLGIDVASDEAERRSLEQLGAREFQGLYVDPARARDFPGGLDSSDGQVGAETYAALTATLAARHADWGQGVLVGDPDLVAAQLPKARRLRLVPLYGRPQTDVFARTEPLLRAAREPVYGRQYDDHDFFTLARAGRGFQIVDPAPPFDSGCTKERAFPSPPAALWDVEPDDEQLERWADERRVLVTLLLWSGMIRELDCIPRLIDLVAATELRAGLVITSATVEHAIGSELSLLSVPSERGGVFGLLEPLLGSTGAGVAAEAMMPPGALERSLVAARVTTAEILPDGLVPRGWWPLLDTALVPHRTSRVGWRAGRPLVRFSPRGPGERDGGGGPRNDARARVGRAVRSTRLASFVEARRPFEHLRPGEIDQAVAEAVRAAGFTYMWTKASFGAPNVPFRRGDFLALSLTAGNWDGWSPFYTAGAAADIVRAERRLLRAGRPGWLATTIDSPLWALPGELLEHGAGLYRIAELVAGGGRTGKLINVTPHVVARYARLLDERRSGARRG